MRASTAGRGRRGPAALLAALSLLAVAAPAAGQGFRFRADATRVLVDALVLDAAGDPIPGLRAADFRLFEDGAEQRIASVEVVGAGPPFAPGSGPLPSAATDRSAADRGPTPRRFVIVFNRRQADPVKLRRAKRGLLEFLENDARPDDETMILDLGASLRVLRELGTGREEALAAARRIVPGGISTAVGGGRDARDSFRLIAALGDALEPLDGRKVVILFSVGLEAFAGPGARGPFGRRRFGEGNALLAAIRQLNHANATLYAVDLEGVFGNEDLILKAHPDGPSDSFADPSFVSTADANFPGGDPMGGDAAALAVSTGGEYYPNSTNFAVPLARIARQNSLYYLLTYSPERAELDDSYRRLEVRVPGRRGARVVSRPGYFARERRGGSPAGAAARGDHGYALPESLHTYAYLLYAVPGGAFAALHAALPESRLAEPGEASLRVLDSGGGVLALSDGPVDRRRFWVSGAAPLPAGEHRFEVSAGPGDGGPAEGFLHPVSTELVVPADYGGAFSLSSVFPFAAESDAAGAGPPVRPVAAFAAGEPARFGFFAFPGRRDPPERVRLSYRVRGERGEMVVEADRPGLVTLDPARLEGVPLRLEVDTAGWVAARYTLVVRVAEADGPRAAASELDFEVR